MTRALRRHPDARPFRMAGHETRVVSGAPEVWIVDAGSVAVFGTDIEDGRPVGPRQFLFRGGRGSALWVTHRHEARAPGLLAVPVDDVEGVALPLAAVWARLQDAPEAVRPLLGGWTGALAGHLGAASAPRAAARVDTPRALTLAPGEAAHAGGAGLWAVVETGAVAVCGRDDWRLDADAGPLPLSDALWLRARGEGARVRFLAPEALPDAAALGQGLAHVERILLSALERAAAAEREAERRRLRERAARQGRLADAAARELAGTFDTERVTPQRATPLLTAVGAVLETLDVEVQPPAASERGRHRVDEVEAIARASGVRMRRVLLEPAWWTHDCGPLLAFQGEARRPVALLLGRGQRYTLVDPVARTVTPLTPALAATLQPEAVTWYRPLPPRPLGLRHLVRFSLHARGRDFALLGITAALATLLGMLTPLATATVMDSAIPEANRRLLFELGLALLAAAFGQVLFRLSQGYVSARMATRARQDGQAAVWDRLLGLRPAFFRRHSSGDLLDRAMAVQQIGEQLGGATIGGLFSGLMALLNLGLLLYYSLPLALLAVAVALLTAVVTALSAGLIRRRALALQEANGAFSSFKLQAVQGVAKLRVAGAESRAYAQWMRRYGETMRLTLGIARVEDGAAVANVLIASLSTAALFGLGYGLLAGGLSLGVFLAFMAAYGTFLAGTAGVSNTLVGLFDTLAAARRIQPILAEAPESHPSLGDPGLLAGRFSADHVTFRYRDDGPETLKDVSIHAEPGEFVALVGPSGSGKSTLLRLLLGFETPGSGGVYYDGMDLAGIDVRAVRRQLGVVLQDSRLSQGSILDNMTTGAPVPLDEAWEAARKAAFEDDLKAMPMGMHTVVSEGGANLSGGQRQRLLIARALVYKPKVLFFDEATSALDSRTQAVVSASLEQMNVTRFVIAHRLSTVRNADRIYVLDRGRVVEEGTFDELAAAGGLFARMMARQKA